MKATNTLAIISLVCATMFGCAEDFTNDIDELNLAIDLLNGQFNNMSDLATQQQQDIDAYRDQIEQLNSDLEQAKSDAEKAKSEAEQSKKDMDAANEKLDNTLEEVNKAKEDAIKAADDANEIAKKQESTIKEQQHQIDNLNEDLNEAKDTAKEQQEQINGLNDSLKEANDTINDQKETIKEQQEQIDGINGDIDGINDTIDNLNVSKDGDRIIYPVTTYPDGSQSVSTQPFDTVLNKWCYYTNLVYKDVSATCCLANLEHEDKNPLNEEIKTFLLWRDLTEEGNADDYDNLQNDLDFSRELIDSHSGWYRIQEMQIMPIVNGEKTGVRYMQYDKLSSKCRENDEVCLTYISNNKDKIVSNNYFFSWYGTADYFSEGDIILAYSVAYRVIEKILVGSSFYIHKLEEIGVAFVSKIFFCKQ